MEYTYNMIKPTWQEEEKLQKLGHRRVAGLDEAGRGAWAGPIVAAAVILFPGTKLPGLRDSKLLTPKQREKLFLQLVKEAVAWSVGIISQTEIDKHGVGRANEQAMLKAVERLQTHYPDFLLIDALKIQHTLPRKAIVKGDQKVMSIAAASIIAKVTRDYIMDEAHKQYPNYGFHLHKGYGTAHHQAMLRKHGVSKFHRKSYKPIKKIIAG